MKKVKSDDVLMYGGLGLLLYFLWNFRRSGSAQIEPGWSPSPYATINAAKAGAMAQNIKSAIGYLDIDWNAIATQFEKLANRYDVEVLYKSFGQWDGPYGINGDLFQVLNEAYDYSWSPFDGPDLASIKAHCYEYSNNVKW